MKQKADSSQQGIVHLLLLAVIVFLIIGASAFAIFKRGGFGGGGSDNEAAWKTGCTSKDRVQMTHLPMDLNNVTTFSPYGMTAGAHVTPIDHLYMYPKGTERDAFPVYAMADGHIKEITSRSVMTDTGQAKEPEYRIIMQHSCQTISYFDLVTSLDPAIAKEFNPKKATVNIPIKGGQVIGRIGGQSLDTAIYNLDLTLPGFISPEMYKAEFWKIHTDDFISYFDEPLHSQLLARQLRKIPPYSGKIDYDQPGKLIGNWFLEGSNGYGGPTGEGPGKDGHGYWDGHLAIFYDALDGQSVVISVGRFGPNGQPQAFEVTGNTPDPAKIDQASGITKYELRQQSPKYDPSGKLLPPAATRILGVALFQVLGSEKLKVEFFAGKPASEVTSFTSSAKTYER